MLFLIVLAYLSGLMQVQVPTSMPRFDYTMVLGCGDVFLHAVNSSETEILQIEADFARVGGGARARHAFDLANTRDGLLVAIAVYPERYLNRPNCSDVFVTEEGKPPPLPVLWRAIRGNLSIERGPRGTRPEEPWLFQVKIRLVNAVFRNVAGETIRMDRVFTWEGFVGWAAG